MTYLVFYIIFICGISLAATSALLCDLFFFISLRHRRLSKREIGSFKFTSGISALGSVISLISLIVLSALRISSGIEPGEHIIVILSLLLLITFVLSVNMRNVHLPTLKRHQHDYHHLSDSFAHIQESLLSQSSVSIISWIFILTVLSADSRDIILSFGFWTIFISYIVIAYLFSKFAVVIKRMIS